MAIDTDKARIAAEVARQRALRKDVDEGSRVLAKVAGGAVAVATAPVGAITRVLQRAGWTAAEVDLYEVNEAFACVAMIAMHDLGIPHDKINVHGGATALGHPIGASGARVLATLLSALDTHGGRKGVASLCIGGGEATAMAVELMD